jgi:uncharacterized protein (TIGR00645 family)
MEPAESGPAEPRTTIPGTRIEMQLGRMLFASRWLMAPIYLGLVLSLFVLLIKFAEELWHFLTHAFSATESEVIIGLLALIDMSLAGNLVLMVIFAGYENFVAKIEFTDKTERPDWMGKVDFSGLKLKLLGSIVAISAIQLLRAFMDINHFSDRDLTWLAIIHGVFVVSGVFLAVSDLIAERSHQTKAGHSHQEGGRVH